MTPEVTRNGEQRCRSGESARLPPMWPGFDSRTQRHMWVDFVVGSLLAPGGFSLVLRFSPLPKSKPNISKFQFDLECAYTYKRVPESS